MRRTPHDASRPAEGQRLAEAMIRGDVVPFDEIYRVFAPRVRVVCRRYLRDSRDVEEAVQDTFVKAAAALPRFNGSFRLGSWLARIAANASIDVARKNRRRLEVVAPLDDEADELFEPFGDAGEDDILAVEVLGRIRPEHARALHLRSVEGASLTEIGHDLGKSPEQAKALLHRARVAFRRVWQDLGGRVAFYGVAGAMLAWRTYRNVLSASPALTRVQASAAGAADSLAPPTAAVVDAIPFV